MDVSFTIVQRMTVGFICQENGLKYDLSKYGQEAHETREKNEQSKAS